MKTNNNTQGPDRPGGQTKDDDWSYEGIFWIQLQFALVRVIGPTGSGRVSREFTNIDTTRCRPPSPASGLTAKPADLRVTVSVTAGSGSWAISLSAR